MIFILLLVLALCVAMIANHKGFNTVGWFFYGFFLFIIAIIHVLVARPKAEKIAYRQGNIKCLYCAEYIKKEAKTCKHCHKEIFGADKNILPQPKPIYQATLDEKEIFQTNNKRIDEEKKRKRTKKVLILVPTIIASFFLLCFVTGIIVSVK
jgi:hypothetical protein